MNQSEAINFIKTITVAVQAKVNRKRKNALSPLVNDAFDSSAAINQKKIIYGEPLDTQDKVVKTAFADFILYVIKVRVPWQIKNLISNIGNRKWQQDFSQNVAWKINRAQVRARVRLNTVLGNGESYCQYCQRIQLAWRHYSPTSCCLSPRVILPHPRSVQCGHVAIATTSPRLPSWAHAFQNL